MLEVIHWLGVASSDNLKEFLHLSGVRNAKNKIQTITDLFHEDNNEDGDFYLERPAEQFPHAKIALQRRHLHLAHDLGLGGINFLKRKGKWRKEIVHGGHWEHQLQESTFLWEIFLGVKRAEKHGFTFKPHYQSAPMDCPNAYKVPITVDKKTIDTELKPDGHFLIDYATKGMHYFYEADRGTEQKEKVIKGKKTVERMLMQYRAFIGSVDGEKPIYKRVLNTDLPALVLMHFSKRSKKEAAMQLLHDMTKGNGNNFILFRDDERFADTEYPPPNLSYANWEGPWERVGRPPVHICEYPK